MTGGLKRRRRRAALLLLALLAPLIAAGLDTRLRVVLYTVETEEVASPVALAVLTDLHSCAYGEGQGDLVDRVRRFGPDAVLLVGDIVDDKLPEENAWTAVEALAADFPCCYVTGNHEWWSGEAERICADMERRGVAVLRGTEVLLPVEGGKPLRLWGIDDPCSGESEGQLSALTVPEEGFSLLLAHRPEEIEAYLRHPFDLVVAGHAHGGQWRIPGLLNGLYAPDQGLFPRYAGGRYDVGDATLLVSRGLSRENTWIPRLFNPPELVFLRIVPK